MLDFDLADLYDVETRALNQAIKRNAQSFPPDFMFRLTHKEMAQLMSSQNVMTSLSKRPKIALPLAFTEHGVTMLASVLKSNRARKMSITIVRAFIAMKEFILRYEELVEQIKELKTRTDVHDKKLQELYEAIEALLLEKQHQWKNLDQIGFRKDRVALCNHIL